MDAVTGSMPEGDWVRLQKYGRFIGMPRAAFEVQLRGWFTRDGHPLSRLGLALLVRFGETLAWITAAATLVALVSLPRRRRRGGDVTAEITILASTAFLLAVILTTALSFTFDIGRYAASFMPLAITWWLCSIAYLLLAAARVFEDAWKRRQGGPASTIGPTGVRPPPTRP